MTLSKKKEEEELSPAPLTLDEKKAILSGLLDMRARDLIKNIAWLNGNITDPDLDTLDEDLPQEVRESMIEAEQDKHDKTERAKAAIAQAPDEDKIAEALNRDELDSTTLEIICGSICADETYSRGEKFELVSLFSSCFLLGQTAQYIGHPKSERFEGMETVFEVLESRHLRGDVFTPEDYRDFEIALNIEVIFGTRIYPEAATNSVLALTEIRDYVPATYEDMEETEAFQAYIRAMEEVLGINYDHMLIETDMSIARPSEPEPAN